MEEQLRKTARRDRTGHCPRITKKRSISLLIAAHVFAALFAAPTVALAEEAAGLQVDAVQSITWVAMTITSGDHSRVTIKIVNVSRRSTRLWQRCDFIFNGTGTYRCGIDSKSGSLAQAQRGEWIAKAFTDGNLVDRQRFSL